MSVPATSGEDRSAEQQLAAGGIPAWEELTAAEQHLLLAALAEKPLWLARVSSDDSGVGAPAAVLRVAARRMVEFGLVWFYRLEQGYPDVTAVEVDRLCADDVHWRTSHDGHRYGLYLTDAGECMFPLFGDAAAAVES